MAPRITGVKHVMLLFIVWQAEQKRKKTSHIIWTGDSEVNNAVWDHWWTEVGDKKISMNFFWSFQVFEGAISFVVPSALLNVALEQLMFLYSRKDWTQSQHIKETFWENWSPLKDIQTFTDVD